MDLFLVYHIEPRLRIRESPAQGHMVYRCGPGTRSGYFRKRSHDRRFSNDDLVTIVRKNASKAVVLEGIDTLIVMGVVAHGIPARRRTATFKTGHNK